VIALAFDRCEAAVSNAVCGARPDALCTGCGTARCHDHGTGATGDRSCSTCSASLLTLATAPFDAVLDTRLRSLAR
jgi:hypothetical protein